MLEILIVVGFVALDQVAKYLTDLYLSPLGTSFPLWKGVFHFTSAHNTGAAFSMFSGGRWVFIALTIVVCAAIIWILVRKRKSTGTLFRVALALILAGAIGNLIDRALFGYVRDMLDFCLIHFAVFNVADSALTIGAILLVIDLIFVDGGKLFASHKKEDQRNGAV